MTTAIVIILIVSYLWGSNVKPCSVITELDKFLESVNG